MPTLKYSRQRASIKEYLDGTVEHPTADMVYMKVKQQFPSISLGTVYRNLNLLADMGEIRKLSTPDGGDRFDANLTPHYHVVCSSCGKVYDIMLPEESIRHINESANACFDGDIVSHDTLFYGICQHCKKGK